jgi:hypothetical protein
MLLRVIGKERIAKEGPRLGVLIGSLTLRLGP